MKLIQKTLPVFTLAQFSVVGLFVFIMVMTFSRLTEVKDALTKLTSHSIPTLSQASKLTQEIQQLVTLTAGLSRSENESSRRLTKQKIDDSLDRLNSPAFRLRAKDEFIFTQLTVLTQEIEELNNLIITQIKIQKDVREKTELLFNFMSTTFFELNSEKISAIQRTALSALFLNAAQIAQQNRLHSLRQLASAIKSSINDIRQINSSNTRYIEAIDNLEEMLVSDKGLINQKIETLRISGRARGRGNFVRNLVEDIARGINYQSDLVSSITLTDSNEATLRVASQTRLTLVSAIAVIVISLFFIFYLYKRIVLRLISLSSQVENAIAQETSAISMHGNDEIALLGRTFENYLQKVKSQERELLQLTLSDPLTGIPNRRAFENNLVNIMAQATRHNWPVSVLMIDVDYFKYYNDCYGHTKGDECLKRIAYALNTSIKRTTDLCARFGGEEFIVLLPNTNSAGAHKLAERLRTCVEQLQLTHKQSGVSNVITVSIGMATFSFTRDSVFTKDELVEAADKALYRAKALGRNRCSFDD